MGVIPGHIKNEVVVVGNHRDGMYLLLLLPFLATTQCHLSEAWVMGATDPSSGTVSVHEVIRGLGHLLRKGWKPLRTILIASWDAEEVCYPLSKEWPPPELYVVWSHWKYRMG